jgi:glyoxylase-like metal-dependent hydrolase (beta-lactamase superfamily II)
MLFGDYRVEIVPDTEFCLDGGAMFGVVPRVLWERRCPPDDQNRIKLNLNCLFIDTGKEKILIETGIGEKWSSKEIKMYGINREYSLAESLFRITGCRTDDITIVINTHLHFDHAGGNTINDAVTGKPVPQFPNARYLVSKREFEHAEAPHERDRASYLGENWHPLIDSQQMDLMPDTYEPVPGLLVEKVRGHSETMQTIKLSANGQILFGFFDMVPTRHHLQPAWIMAYDLFPTETLAFKNNILPIATQENWVCHFYHDPEMPLATLVEIDGRVKPVPFPAKTQ